MDRTRRSLLGTAGMALAAAGGARLAPAAAAPAASAPTTRQLPIMMVPVLTHEYAGFLDYLTAAFAKGGMLDGKEVFGFYPSHLSAYAGDTLELTCYNPADDPHTMTFVELGQNVDVPGGQSAKITL